MKILISRRVAFKELVYGLSSRYDIRCKSESLIFLISCLRIASGFQWQRVLPFYHAVMEYVGENCWKFRKITFNRKVKQQFYICRIWKLYKPIERYYLLIEILRPKYFLHIEKYTL